MNHFLMLPISNQLSAEVSQLNAEMSENNGDHAQRIVRVMDQYVKDLITACLHEPADLIGFKTKNNRFVNKGLDALTALSTELVAKLVSERDNDSLQDLKPVFKASFDVSECGRQKSMARIKIERELAFKGLRLCENIRTAENPLRYRDESVEFLMAIVQVIARETAVKPIKILKVSRFVDLYAEGAVFSCVLTSKGLIKYVFKRLDAEQLKRVVLYYSVMLVNDA